MRIDIINIGLMVCSGVLALVLPVQLFLFSYAVLGPLHYLTEISWLHDRQYFTQRKYDFLPLLLLAGLCSLPAGWLGFTPAIFDRMIFLALGAAATFALARSPAVRGTGLLLTAILALILFYDGQGNTPLSLLIGTLLPTLIHVFVFTGLFILYGALKSKSTSGLLSFVVFVTLPVLLFSVFPDTPFIEASPLAREAYSSGGQGFFSVNLDILEDLFGISTVAFGKPELEQVVFSQSPGLGLMRSIAYAYTYHYLNWFSKTEIIRWHLISRARLIAIGILWMVSVGLYVADYATGLKWLFFLSFAHVILEFPLNAVSIQGITRELRGRRT